MENKRLVVASHNPNKIQEIKALLASTSFEVLGLPELGDIPPTVEDGDTFQANAEKKAVEIAQLLNSLTLADDSGLEVDALQGAPGVYSARFAGEQSNDQRNNEFLLEKMKSFEQGQRGAQFRCVMALASPTGHVEFSEGVVRGEILTSPRGTAGFGYDPLFYLASHGQTFAELSAKEKNQISHRFLALQGILRILTER